MRRCRSVVHLVGDAKSRNKPIIGYPVIVEVFLIGKEDYSIILADSAAERSAAHPPRNWPVMILRRKERRVITKVIGKG